jgi:AraC-like DNA-binding protein
MQLIDDLPETAASTLSHIQAYIIKQVKAGRKFTIKDISEELNLSEYNMNKVLIKETRQTLKSYIANCRREQYVKEMVANGRELAVTGEQVICRPCRKTGIQLSQLSSKRVRLQ